MTYSFGCVDAFRFCGVCIALAPYTYGLPHDKMYKMACAPSEDSDQPGYQPSLISLRCPHEGQTLSATTVKRYNWAASWQNQQNGMCTQQRLRSGCTVSLFVLSWGGSYMYLRHEIVLLLKGVWWKWYFLREWVHASQGKLWEREES